MTIVSDLRGLPLFQGISEARLTELVAAFRPATHAAGKVLFKPGDLAATFDILTKGEVTIEEEGSVRFQLRPPMPLGELGSLTSIPRSTTATTATEVELLSIKVGDLLGFFDEHPDVGLAFFKNLLGVVSDKVNRDRRRMDDMRFNIIRTQKAMKQLRELVLESEETTLSKPIFESLDACIQNNRRANYRVSPTPAYPSKVRLDDGRFVNVLEVSEGYLKVSGKAAELTKDPSFWAGVLVTPTAEILVSGSVLREAEDGVVVKLDPMVDEFKAQLDDYTTRLQLLDFVV